MRGGPRRAGLQLNRAGPLEDWAGPPDAVWAIGLGRRERSWSLRAFPVRPKKKERKPTRLVSKGEPRRRGELRESEDGRAVGVGAESRYRGTRELRALSSERGCWS
ncbi:hypothetical protein CDL15_Pgr016562 [Punica granatum]|nr:hypothetical protein CDL15_Pgr016562 [Punica granatum]